ncbi:MAG: sigma-54-dependent Fis family transcriptional regulator [Labilithrix sp.]|nr:sigma-54-dependent Fis family transcriptional regulator [Labilithrix sp.]MCW5813230.1 sigma-54-dependent Fis family transcriptional regulator [Labilithrix sp.]
MGDAVAHTLRRTSRGDIISVDARLVEVLETIDRVARSSVTVLVTGESGTGKELIVAALHDASTRHSAPLITINCGAIPNDLVESELFGHAKGAFTGAQSTRRGLVAAAEGGTLFLDEVGELPLLVQVKLLRLLQQREYTPLGETRAVKCDVRIAAATNRDLEAEVKAGRFREDLFYRLNVIHLELPPLRERRNDLELLAKHFCRVLAERSGRDDLKGLSPAAVASIVAFPWPGNVRALENALERGVLLAKGPFVEPHDVFGRMKGGKASGPVPASEPAPTPEPPKAAVEAELRAMLPNVEAPVSTPSVASVPEPVSITEAAAAADEPPSEAARESIKRASNPMFPRQLPDVGLELFTAVDAYQNDLIRQALARTAGNRNRAAQLLGLNRTTLVEMIRRRKL